MKLIVGLGNPGEKYITTRHNTGFMAVDFILERDGFLQAKPSKEFKSKMFVWLNGGEKIVFLKPQTFMNDSGQALKVICNFYKLDLAKDLLVIHDDADLPLGKIRLADSSSSAGHKGVQSIIDELSTQNFNRLRIGIETRQNKDLPPTDDFVLQNFTLEQKQILETEVFPKIYREMQIFLNINI